MLAERKVAQNRAPVWLYSFDWETPVHDGKLKAYHALDVPFVFNTIDNVNATDRGPVAHELSRRMCATWATFARTGKVDWPAYTADTRTTMVFNDNSATVDDPDKDVRPLWSKVATA